MSQNDNKTQVRQMENSVLLPEVVSMIGEGHTVTLPLRGYSMRPFLEDGRDKAVLSKPHGVCVGDVVLAEVDSRRYVLHRVVGINGSDIVLRGDGNIGVERCQVDDIKAKATAFIRKGRTTPDYAAGRKWRLYSFVWTGLLPIRRYLLFAYRKLFV